VQANAKDVTRKTFSYAEQNIAAAFDLAQKMVRARDMQEAMQVQAEYVRRQFESIQAQMRELGSLAQGAVQTAANQATSAARDATTEKK
jgi:phasin